MGTNYGIRFKVLILATTLLWSFPGNAGEWEQHKQTLQNLVSSTADLEKEISELIKRKRHEKDRSELQKIMKDIDTKHKKLEETYKKYNDEINHTKYRHPEQGDMAERTYKILKPRTMEEMENDIGLDGKLDRIKGELGRHLNVPPAPPTAKKKVDKEEEAEKDQKPERIIIKK